MLKDLNQTGNPIGRQREEEIHRRSEDPGNRNGVLVIEDRPADRLLIRRMIENSPFPSEIVSASTLEEAFERMATGDIQIVVLDLGLPGYEELAALTCFKEQFPDLPVIVFTGGENAEWGSEAIRKGAQDFLVEGKVSPDIVGRALRYALERHQFEQQRQEEKERYRSLFNQTTEGIILLEDGKVCDCNPAALAVLGVDSREELLGRAPFEFSPDRQPDGSSSKEGSEELIRRALEGESLRFTWKHSRGDGEVVDTEISLSSYSFRGKKLVQAVLRDTTRQLKNQRTVDAFFNQSGNLHLICRTDGQIVRVNRGWEQILGYTTEDLVGGNILDFIHPDDVEATRDALTTLTRDGRLDQFENRYRHREGHYRHISWSAASNLEDGLLFGVAADVTDQIEAQNRIAESDKRFRNMAESINEVFWISSPDFSKMLYVSPAYERIWGRSVESLMSNPMSWQEAIHPEDRDRVCAVFASCVEKKGAESEYRVVRPDGEVRWVEDKGYPVYGSEGKVLQISGIARDITDRKHLEEETARLQDEFHRAQRMEVVGQLAGGIAHDFNNLLQGIMSYTEMARSKPGDAAALENHLDQIESAATRASQLTGQMLSFGRRQQLQKVNLDFRQVVESTFSILSPILPENVEVVQELSDELLCVVADHGQLEQCLINIILNARDAMEAGGRMTARAFLADGEDARLGMLSGSDRQREYVVFQLEDIGAGIPEDILPRITEPFFTTKPVGKGTGLGLASVTGIVEQHGGFLNIRSQPGQGTTVTILLPCSDESGACCPTTPGKPTRTDGTGESRDSGKPIRILVVDDNEMIRNATSGILETHGFDVVKAEDGQQAVQAIRQATVPFDLIVMDRVMPELGGAEALQSIREDHPQLPCIFMSGYDESGADDLTGDPYSAFLPKPFRSADLLEKINALLVARSG